MTKHTPCGSATKVSGSRVNLMGKIVIILQDTSKKFHAWIKLKVVPLHKLFNQLTVITATTCGKKNEITN